MGVLMLPCSAVAVSSLFFPQKDSPTLKDQKTRALTVSGVVWRSSDQWTVWVNGSKICSTQEHPIYEVLSFHQKRFLIKDKSTNIVHELTIK